MDQTAKPAGYTDAAGRQGAITLAARPEPIAFDAAATATDKLAETTKAPTKPRPAPQSEPEPIDLLEVAGGAAFTRFAAPAAAVAVLGILVALIVRRRR